MPKRMTSTYLFDGGKSVPLESLPAEAWTFLTGGPDGAGRELKSVFEAVPWLFRGVHLCSQAVQDMPFEILRGDEVVDTSGDYQNAVGYLPDIYDLLYKTEGALTLHGRAYAYVVANVLNKPTKVRWLMPPSIRNIYSPADGLVGFSRRVGADAVDLPFERVAYIPYPNFFSETERGRSPAEAALAAAGVLMSMDDFAATFFERGAIKATLLTVDGEPAQEERDRLLSWWRRIFAGGVKNAFGTDVVSASVKAVPVGDGIKDLGDQALSKEKREDISTALGIPQSILFSTGAINRAVSEQDDLTFYMKRIIPDARIIQQAWNPILFQPFGYRIRFTPQDLSVFQADESDRASSLRTLVDAGIDLYVALEILGYDLTEEQMARQAGAELAKEERRAAFLDRLNKAKPSGNGDDKEEVSEEGEDGAKGAGSRSARPSGDLDRFMRKAIRRFRETGSAAVEFESAEIDPSLKAWLDGVLEVAASEEEIRRLFSEEWRGYP